MQPMSRPGRSLEAPLASALLFAALALHNLEEALTYANARGAAQRLIGQILPDLRLPPPALAQGALLGLTLVGGALLLWAARTRNRDAAWFVLRITAAVLLANVLAPHVPAAIALGGYAPGLVTAVAINLPLGLWILARARSTGQMR